MLLSANFEDAIKAIKQLVKENPAILEEINKPKHTIKDTQQTYRIINHWGKEGLLDDSRENKEWRKFSDAQLAWIALIVEFRKYGLNLKEIKELKTVLFDIYEKYGITLIEFAFIFASQLKSKFGNIYLIYYRNNKQIMVTTFDNLVLSQPFKGLDMSYLLFNLSAIWYTFFGKEKISICIEHNVAVVSENDRFLLSEAKKGFPDELIIKKDGMKIKSIEKITKTKGKDITKAIEEVKKNGYGEITIKVQDGETVLIETKENKRNEK